MFTFGFNKHLLTISICLVGHLTPPDYAVDEIFKELQTKLMVFKLYIILLDVHQTQGWTSKRTIPAPYIAFDLNLFE